MLATLKKAGVFNDDALVALSVGASRTAQILPEASALPELQTEAAAESSAQRVQRELKLKAMKQAAIPQAAGKSAADAVYGEAQKRLKAAFEGYRAP